MQQAPLGFDQSNVFTLQFRLPQNKYPKPENIARFFKNAIENVRAIPNVESAALVRAVFESYAYVADLLEDKNTSIRRLRQLFFGARTEKTEAVVGQKARKPEVASPADTSPTTSTGTSMTATSITGYRATGSTTPSYSPSVSRSRRTTTWPSGS